MRTIRPEFFTDDTIAELEPRARLLLLGLKALADREGRLADRPRQIKAFVFAYDDFTVADIECDLHELATCEHPKIIRYKAADGLRLIQISDWHLDQKPHMKEGPSTFPAPTERATSTAPALPQHLPSTDPAATQHGAGTSSALIEHQPSTNIAALRTENGERRMENSLPGVSTPACLSQPDPIATLNAKRNKRFEKPTIQDVSAYCAEKGLQVDAEQFWHFYESKGWMVGRNQMKEWRAALHTWHSKAKCQNGPTSAADDIPLLKLRSSFDDESEGSNA